MMDLTGSLRLLPCVALVALGCARAPGSRLPVPASGDAKAARVAPPARPPDASAAVLPALPEAAARARAAALRFEIADDPFPSPLVDAVIAGQPTTMIVDTGATHHVVARWLADELSTPLSSAGDVGVDHAGHALKVARLEDASLTVSGWGPVPASPLLVVAVPDPLRHLGIGGFLSPQALAEDGRAVTLDLRAGTLRDAPLAEAGARLEEGGALTPARLCGAPGHGVRILTTATIEGLPVELQVDTGAFHSSIGARSPAGLRLAGRAGKTTSAYVASGRVAASTVEAAKITVGALTVSAELDLVSEAPRLECGGDGFLGMDVLRACVILIAQSSAAIRCGGR